MQNLSNNRQKNYWWSLLWLSFFGAISVVSVFYLTESCLHAQKRIKLSCIILSAFVFIIRIVYNTGSRGCAVFSTSLCWLLEQDFFQSGCHSALKHWRHKQSAIGCLNNDVHIVILFRTMSWRLAWSTCSFVCWRDIGFQSLTLNSHIRFVSLSFRIYFDVVQYLTVDIVSSN